MPKPPTPIAPLVAMVGYTASGKTGWGIDLAEALDGEVIGADSRQVYRQLDIGTAKPTLDERARVPHHCIDHVDPAEQYHLARYLRDARAAVEDVGSRGKRAILVGGTGQYVWALLEGWSVPEVEPDLALREALTAEAERDGAAALHARLTEIDATAARRIHPNNVRRLIRALEVHQLTGRPISDWHEERHQFEVTIVAPDIELERIDRRIASRVDAMFAAGLVAETEALLAEGLEPEVPGLQSIGYSQVVQYLLPSAAPAPSLDETIEAVKLATRQLARAQAKWFRRDDPRIRWFPPPQAALSVLGG